MKSLKNTLKIEIFKRNHWDTFEDWYYEKIADDDNWLDDEEKDIKAKNLLQYLTEMKYTINDAKKIKTQIIYNHDEFEKACDDYIKECHNKLISSWIEK